MSLEDLAPSNLGTKEHWDEVYERELENFYECGDEGEIWFGRQCERQVVEWVDRNIPRDTQIVDLGSGNGHLLVSLAQKGFTKLAGVDYSEGAVRLGSEYAESCGFGQIVFKQGDVLDSSTDLGTAFLVIDKGTFDAISLAEEDLERSTTKGGRIEALCKKFKSTLLRILPRLPNARFLITSCNWTRDELCLLFSPEFLPRDEVSHQTFSFGGQVGQTVTTIAFQPAE